jgi:hypothetical protein
MSYFVLNNFHLCSKSCDVENNIVHPVKKKSFYEYRKKSLPSNLPWVDICVFKWKINNIVYHKKNT